VQVSIPAHLDDVPKALAVIAHLAPRPVTGYWCPVVPDNLLHLTQKLLQVCP
jgi:hypothetical protein